MKSLFLLVVLSTLIIFSNNSFAKEMRIGELRSIDVNSKAVSIHFKGFAGRSCLVDVIAIDKNGKETFFKSLTFDKHREERYLSIGGKEILIFYVQKGLVVVIDNEEV